MPIILKDFKVGGLSTAPHERKTSFTQEITFYNKSIAERAGSIFDSC